MLSRKKRLFFYSILVLWIGVTSCSNSGAKLSPLSIRYLNGTSFENSASTFRVSENFSISIQLENTNKVCIVFPYDFGVEIFYEQDGILREVDNLMEYVPHDNVTIDGKGSLFPIEILTITPDIEDLSISEPINFTAKITGAICKTNEVFVQEIPFTIAP
ncbi:MAG: hypothetical protein ACOYZ8_05055 [Chloroflexota bacterium]